MWPASQYSTTPNESLSIISNGNVGIGTIGPAQKLDVNGAIAINGSTVIDSSKNIYPGNQTSNYFGWDGFGIIRLGTGYTYFNGGTVYNQSTLAQR